VVLKAPRLSSVKTGNFEFYASDHRKSIAAAQGTNHSRTVYFWTNNN